MPTARPPAHAPKPNKHEAQKRERRIVVNLNKLGAAATGVRRQFITTLLARKTLPKGAASFVADCLARDSYMLTQHNRDEVAAALLGIDAGKVHAPRSASCRRQRQPRLGDWPGAGAGFVGGPHRKGRLAQPRPGARPQCASYSTRLGPGSVRDNTCSRTL